MLVTFTYASFVNLSPSIEGVQYEDTPAYPGAAPQGLPCLSLVPMP